MQLYDILWLTSFHSVSAAHTNSGTSSALGLACANTFRLPHGASTTCAGQLLRSVFWKLPEREAPETQNVAPPQARKLTEPTSPTVSHWPGVIGLTWFARFGTKRRLNKCKRHDGGNSEQHGSGHDRQRSA
jgi:hypothetical protein